MIERDEVFRIRTARKPGTLARVLAAIGDHDAHVGEIETIYMAPDHNIREITVIAPSDEAVEHIHAALRDLDGVDVVAEHIDRVFARHEGGKLSITPRFEVRTLQDMREVYTPGVARVSQAIEQDPQLADTYTWRGRTVAVVSNGTRVLGLGNIGPAASLPVMEGKALFYAMFVDLNAVPIVLDATDPDDVIETVVRLAPGFGGIHLEDIATPGAYRVEEELDRRLSIPVMHDDQHGTATVLLAAVLSAARLQGRELADLTFGQVGLGAAGSAIASLATQFDFGEVRAYDPSPQTVERLHSLVHGGTQLRAGSEQADFHGTFADADVLVLTTGRARLLDAAQVRPGQMVFALTNPVPEIDVDAAREAGAAVAADGSLVNNVLAYPGLFRGALDGGAHAISVPMKRAAAWTLAELAPEGELLPDPLVRNVHLEVAARVAAAARQA